MEEALGVAKEEKAKAEVMMKQIREALVKAERELEKSREAQKGAEKAKA